MDNSTPLPGQPYIQDIHLEKLETGFRVKVMIVNHGKPVDLRIRAEDGQGNLLKEMTVIETPDAINSYVLHMPVSEGGMIHITAWLQSDTLGVFQQFQKTFQF